MSEPIQPIQLSGIPPTDLDRPMTAAEFAAWLGVGVDWVRRRKGTLPGRIRESGKVWRIWPRCYAMSRAKAAKRVFTEMLKAEMLKL